MVKRVQVIGVGPGGVDQLTVEAVAALAAVDHFVVTEKGADDPLVAARERLLARHLDAVPVVVHVEDPPRERRPARTGSLAAYDSAVGDWHAARARVWEQALSEHDGAAGFLVWGDPAFYDSTLRVLDRITEAGRLVLDVDVVPGVSSLSLLAARHRIVLHEIGQALHVTTGRRLAEAVAGGQDNLVAMLNRDLDLPPEVSDWSIWWGANLGTESEQLVAGPVRDVLGQIETARERAKASAGWVMDVFALRRPE